MGNFGRPVLCVVFWALFVPSIRVAYAQAPSVADSTAIENCLASAKSTIGAACIGIVADPCIKSLNNDDESGTKAKACAARELAVWAVKLPAAVKTININARGYPQIRKSVAAAQKTWLASREALCPLFGKIDPGTFVGGADYCRIHETGRRVLLLLRLGEALKEH
jgi:hypothetical protein